MSERFILPLRKYEVTFDSDNEPVAFTADSMAYNRDDQSYYFYSTGNVIRVIAAPGVEQIVVTPVDDA